MNFVYCFNNLSYLFVVFIIIYGAISAIFSENAIHGIFYLIAVFLQGGLIMLYLGAEYIAFVFFIVYIGAIAVLFLSVAMMLNTKTFVVYELRVDYIPTSIIFVFIFFSIVEHYYVEDNMFNLELYKNFDLITLVEQNNNIVYFGILLYDTMAFVLAMIALFVGMVGAIFPVYEEQQYIKIQKYTIFEQHIRSSNVKRVL